MRLRAVVVLIVCIAIVLSPAIYAQSAAPKATIVTKAGDTIEGTIFFASESELIVLIAGQQVKVPIAGVRYVSFEGKLSEGGTSAAPVVPSKSSPLADALAAFSSFAAASEIGMLRDQYSAKLLETMPTVRAFIKDATGWRNVRLAMERAVNSYSYPLSSLQAWSSGSTSLAEGRIWADYAAKLAADPAEENHVESTDPRELPALVEQSGRLGLGDRLMDEETDRSSVGGFNDVYTFELPVRSAIEIVMTCVPCTPHLTLLDATGRKVEGDAGYSGTSTIRRTLNPGRYQVWAGSFIGQVGHYTILRRGRQ